MTNAYLEYLTSNENIAYPFKENSIALDYSRSIVDGSRSFNKSLLPTDYISDLTIFTTSSVTAVKLYKIVIKHPNPFTSLVELIFYFDGTPIVISVANLVQAFATHEVLVFTGSWGHMTLVVGPSFSDYHRYIHLHGNLVVTDRTTDVLDLVVEDSLVEPRLNRVESIQIHNPDDITEFDKTTKEYSACYESIPRIATTCSNMLGYSSFISVYYVDTYKELPVVLVPGSNIDLTEGNNTVTINCSPGLGTGIYPCESQLDDLMSQDQFIPLSERILYTINKLSAKDGKFTIKWDDCYRIVPSYQWNSLTIYGDCKPCCDCDDYVFIGESLQTLVKSYLGPANDRVRSFIENNPEKTTGGILTPVIVDTKIWDNYKYPDGISNTAGLTDSFIPIDYTYKDDELVGKMLVNTNESSYIVSNSSSDNTIKTHVAMSWYVGQDYSIKERTWGYNALVNLWNIEVLPNVRNINFDIKLTGGMASAPVSEKGLQSSTIARFYSTLKNFLVANPAELADIFPVWSWIDFDDIFNIRLELLDADTHLPVKDIYAEDTTNFIQGDAETFGFDVVHRNEAATRTSLVRRRYPSSQFQDIVKTHFANELGYAVGSPKYLLVRELCAVINGTLSKIATDGPSAFDRLSLARLVSEFAGVMLTVTYDTLVAQAHEASVIEATHYFDLGKFRFSVIPQATNTRLRWFVTYQDNTGTVEYRNFIRVPSKPEEYFSFNNSIDAALKLDEVLQYMSTDTSILFSYASSYFSENILFIRNTASIYVTTFPSNFVDVTDLLNGPDGIREDITTLFPALSGNINRKWKSKVGFVTLNKPAMLTGSMVGKSVLIVNCDPLKDESEWYTPSANPAEFTNNCQFIFNNGQDRGTTITPVLRSLNPYMVGISGDVYLYLSIDLYTDDLGETRYRWLLTSADITNTIDVRVLFYHDLGVETVEELKYAPWDKRWLVYGSSGDTKPFTAPVGRWRYSSDAFHPVEKQHKLCTNMILCPLNRAFTRPKWKNGVYTPDINIISFIAEISSSIGSIII